jgi:hypothetical protein
MQNRDTRDASPDDASVRIHDDKCSTFKNPRDLFTGERGRESAREREAGREGEPVHRRERGDQ